MSFISSDLHLHAAVHETLRRCICVSLPGGHLKNMIFARTFLIITTCGQLFLSLKISGNIPLAQRQKLQVLRAAPLLDPVLLQPSAPVLPAALIDRSIGSAVEQATGGKLFSRPKRCQESPILHMKSMQP
jgi:hypothetical protein